MPVPAPAPAPALPFVTLAVVAVVVVAVGRTFIDSRAIFMAFFSFADRCRASATHDPGQPTFHCARDFQIGRWGIDIGDNFMERKQGSQRKY